MSFGMNSGRVMELKVLDYADEHVPCPLGQVVDAMSQKIQIPVSLKYVQSVLENAGYVIGNEGSDLIVDRVVE